MTKIVDTPNRCGAEHFASPHRFEARPQVFDAEGYEEYETCGEGPDALIHRQADDDGDGL